MTSLTDHIRPVRAAIMAYCTRICIAVLAAIAMLAVPGIAQAQTVYQYTNTTDSAVNGITNATTCSIAAAFQRDFVVSDSFTIGNVSLGVLASHAYRGDMTMFLRSPAGNIVTVNSGTGGSALNFNVLMDDGNANGLATHTSFDTATAVTAVPPYEENFAPSNSLNATFAGQNSAGTWTLFICDTFSDDDGTFYQADLFLTDNPFSADLSLTKTVSNSAPLNATPISYTLSVTSAPGSDAATNVTVRDVLPTGVIFQSSSGFGTYNSGTGIWTIPSIAAGQTRTLTINVLVNSNQGVAVTNIAQIQTSPNADPDSVPGNGVTTEDDYATASFTVPTRTAGTPPSITAICTAANSSTNLLDWNTQSWTSGSSTGSATLPTIGTVNFSVATEGTYNAPLALTSDNTGGFGTTQLSLYQSIEYTTASQVTTTTVTLPGDGVPGAQFTVFDVDYNYNDFTDQLTVTGSFDGSPVTPTLTNGSANYISGGSAIGDQASGGTAAGGNVVVTFDQPIDTITIIYGNGPTIATTDPDGQAISIYDFTFCNPSTVLSVTKISNVVSDPTNGTSNPKAIPGATMRYCILISNPGTATADNITATDSLPGNITYVPGSMLSGANCASATTAEDDNNSGADETDPFGAAIAGSVITMTSASLASGAGFALVFQATVD